MKSDDIKVGMTVGIREAGRGNRLLGLAKVVEVRVDTGSSWKRRTGGTKVHMLDKEGNPSNRQSYDPQTKKMIDTDKPNIRTFLNQQLVSMEGYDAIRAEKAAQMAERERIASLHVEAQKEIYTALERGGFPPEVFHISTRYQKATEDKAECVTIDSVTIGRKGVDTLLKLLKPVAR